MAAMTESDVLIVGAGPVGLTLAIDLAWRGIDVTMVETRARARVSTMVTSMPRHARSIASVSPTGPAPTISTSDSVMAAISCRGEPHLGIPLGIHLGIHLG